MPISVTSNMIYIGRLPVVDWDEGNWTAENPGALLGTYGFPDLHIVAVQETDENGDGIIDDDESAIVDFVDYTLDGIDHHTRVDTTMLYSAKITLADGSSYTTNVAVLQMPNGDTFVTEASNDGALDNRDIDAIELTGVVDTNYYGHHLGFSVDNATVCLGRGTWIDTVEGPRRIETLAPGARLITADRGARPLRWVARLAPPDRAVVLAPGALAPGLPARRLVVSVQHRMLLCSEIVAGLTGAAEALLPAKRLIGLPGVRLIRGRAVPALYHLGFDRHELIRANGAWTESFLPGPVALATLPPALRRRYPGPLTETVRPVPPGPVQKEILRRHAQLGRPLVSLRLATCLRAC